jgi:hypothetical protein
VIIRGLVVCGLRDGVWLRDYVWAFVFAGVARTKLGCLFRLDQDPEERNDLGGTAEYSSRATDMQAMILEARGHAYIPSRGGTDRRACGAAVARGGFWGPFAV